jgi:hypothetical protein
MKSFHDFEQTIQSPETNDTSYKSQVDFHGDKEKIKKEKNHKTKIKSLPIICFVFSIFR